MTQETLAEALGTDQGTVSRWENEKLRPSLEDIGAIESATGRPYGWILVRAGCVSDVTTPEQAIKMDPDLDDEDRRTLLGSLRVLRRQRR